MAKRKRNIVSCAACRVQRKKCSEECIFAPHFPQDAPEKFTVVHSVYGTKYVIKLLQVIFNHDSLFYFLFKWVLVLALERHYLSCEICFIDYGLGFT